MAHATVPGQNGKIAFVRGGDIWTMKADGTAQVDLTNSSGVTERAPRWSPDGAKIAFIAGGDIYVMDGDGSDVTRIPLGFPNTAATALTWSPDGAQIAYAGCCPPNHDFVVVRMNADGTAATVIADSLKGVDAPDWSPTGTRIAYVDMDPCIGETPRIVVGGFVLPAGPCDTGAADSSASWSPDATLLALTSDPCFCQTAVWSVRPDGTDRSQITTPPSPSEDYGPVWSPDKSKIVFTRASSVNRVTVVNADGSGVTDLTDGSQPDWQPIPINSYPRPRGASPMKISLVPSNRQCTAPNSTHGAPLSYGSCAPPQLASGRLTTGTPDSNGLPVRMDASLLLRVVPGNAATAADEADVRIGAHLNDVFEKDLSDYTGALRASLPLRITDKDNTPSPGGPGAGTTVPFQYGFDIPCAPDPAADLGSDCSISTTADTLVPGTIKEGLRPIWQIGRVRVDDAGPDGNPDTTADNTVFATEGVFVP